MSIPEPGAVAPFEEDEFEEAKEAYADARSALRHHRRIRRRHYIDQRQFSLGEEIANAVTHGLGWLASAVAFVVLLSYVGPSGDPWRIGAAITYGASLVVLYCASTMYHALTAPKAQAVFKVLDHSAIYLLIAGSYTPFTLVLLRGRGGEWLAVVEWTIALIGMSTEALWVDRPKWLASVVYLAMGWMAVFMIRPIAAVMEPAGVWLLIGGGIAYTLGVVFYVFKRVPYFHMVWHLWVLAGSACHFAAILFYVLT